MQDPNVEIKKKKKKRIPFVCTTSKKKVKKKTRNALKIFEQAQNFGPVWLFLVGGFNRVGSKNRLHGRVRPESEILGVHSTDCLHSILFVFRILQLGHMFQIYRVEKD